MCFNVLDERCPFSVENRHLVDEFVCLLPEKSPFLLAFLKDFEYLGVLVLMITFLQAVLAVQNDSLTILLIDRAIFLEASVRNVASLTAAERCPVYPAREQGDRLVGGLLCHETYIK